MEYKTVPTELKADGDQGEVAGYYSVFGNVDDGGDVTHRGAFAKTLSERAGRIKVFFAHYWDRMIAPPPDELREDDHGLFARYKLILDSFWGREAWALIKGGAMTEGSYGYDTIKHDFDDDGVRHLRELKLYEISPVPLGMNPLTAINAVKAGAIDTPQFIAALDAALDAVKNGRLLVTAERQQLARVKGTLDALRDVTAEHLAAAEPDAGHSALHEKAIRTRMRAAGLALAQLETNS